MMNLLIDLVKGSNNRVGISWSSSNFYKNLPFIVLYLEKIPLDYYFFWKILLILKRPLPSNKAVLERPICSMLISSINQNWSITLVRLEGENHHKLQKFLTLSFPPKTSWLKHPLLIQCCYSTSYNSFDIHNFQTFRRYNCVVINTLLVFLSTTTPPSANIIIVLSLISNSQS